MRKGYGQFCPVAMAAEVLCERWVPLVLRELMYGATRFNDIARGVPLMSRALLAQRLRALEDARVVRKEADGCYRLTPAGEALRPIVEQMGMWAQHWHRGLAEKDLDDALLMWSLHRSLHIPEKLGRRVVLRFDFHGLPRSARVARRSWWLLAGPQGVDICIKDPGYEVDVLVRADLRALTEVVLGWRPLRAAVIEGQVKLQGPQALVRELPKWLPLNGEAMHGLGLVR